MPAPVHDARTLRRTISSSHAGTRASCAGAHSSCAGACVRVRGLCADRGWAVGQSSLRGVLQAAWARKQLWDWLVYSWNCVERGGKVVKDVVKRVFKASQRGQREGCVHFRDRGLQAAQDACRHATRASDLAGEVCKACQRAAPAGLSQSRPCFEDALYQPSQFPKLEYTTHTLGRTYRHTGDRASAQL